MKSSESFPSGENLPTQAQEEQEDIEQREKTITTIKSRLRNVLLAISLGLSTVMSAATPNLAGARRLEETDREIAESINEYESTYLELKEIYGEHFILLVPGGESAISEKLGLSLPLDSISDLQSQSDIMEKEVLLDLLRSNLPAEWLGNVASIRQTTQEFKLSMAKFGFNEAEAQTVATAQKWKSGKTAIVLYKPTTEETIIPNMETIYHEIAHANDWSRSLSLDSQERVQLLYAVTQRLDAEDRYMSTYVESISNEDKQEEKYLKAVEYWAEICAVYFSIWQQGELSVADYELVRDNVYPTDHALKN